MSFEKEIAEKIIARNREVAEISQILSEVIDSINAELKANNLYFVLAVEKTGELEGTQWFVNVERNKNTILSFSYKEFWKKVHDSLEEISMRQVIENLIKNAL